MKGERGFAPIGLEASDPRSLDNKKDRRALSLSDRVLTWDASKRSADGAHRVGNITEQQQLRNSPVRVECFSLFGANLVSFYPIAQP